MTVHSKEFEQVGAYLGITGAICVATLNPYFMCIGYMCWLISNIALVIRYKELRVMYLCYTATTLLGLYNLVKVHLP